MKIKSVDQTKDKCLKMPEYQNLRIKKETHKRLKEASVKNEKTLSKMIDYLLDWDMLAKSNLDSKIESGDLNK